MKKLILLTLFAPLAWLNAQVYTPNGNIQGSSGNNNLGVGEQSPNARVHIRERAGIGRLLDVGQGAGIMGGGFEYTDYPLELRFTDNSTPTPIANDLRARLYNSGRFDLGDDFTNHQVLSDTRLAIANSMQVFSSFNSYSRLQGNRLSWSNPGSDEFYLSFYNPASSANINVARFSSDGHLTLTNSNPNINATGQPTKQTYGLSILNSGWRNHDYAFDITTGHGQVFTVGNAGTVHIGHGLNRNIPWDPDGDFKLWVEDGIRTERVKVDIAEENEWADYVFEEDYAHMPIEKLKAFIKEHKHLPGVPSAQEVVAEGIDLGEMNKILLEKIEELTLYILHLKEEIDQLKDVNTKLQKTPGND